MSSEHEPSLTGFRFPIARYHFVAQVQGPLQLPEYEGSLLRGVFGAALRRTVCMTNLPVCKECPLYRTCAYPEIFETPPRPTTFHQRFTEVPNPYVMEPSIRGTRLLREGDPFEFSMVVIGTRALQQLPVIVHAWQRALRFGLGKERTPARLLAVHWENSQNEESTVWDEQSQRVIEHRPFLLVPPDPVVHDELLLEVETPLRLQSDGRPLHPEQLDARTLWMATVRRVRLLAQLHGGEVPHAPIDDLLSDASMIREDRSGLRWKKWTRYSSRQGQEMPLGGVVGRWRMTGPVARIWPWLWLSQWCHIGKNATMGLGRLRLVDDVL